MKERKTITLVPYYIQYSCGKYIFLIDNAVYILDWIDRPTDRLAMLIEPSSPCVSNCANDPPYIEDQADRVPRGVVCIQIAESN